MQSTSISRALADLVPDPDAPRDQFLPAFERMADLLLNGAVLHVAGVPHRLTEVEFYYFGGEHRDSFAHCDPIQTEVGRWYFHRSGGTYRGGSYKGLDVTFGQGDAFGGILIRGLERQGSPAALVDGPSLVVDHILGLTNQPSIAALVDTFEPVIDPPRGGDSPLYLAPDPEPGERTVFASARVGLTLKRDNSPERQRLLAAPYRFLTEPARIRKGKPYLIVTLHQGGAPAEVIAEVTGTSAKVIRGYLEHYERGRRLSPDEFTGDLNPADLCALLGACAALDPSAD